MALYYFIDSAGERKLIGSGNIRWTGTWSGSTSYQVKDAATDAYGHNWMALVANTNIALPSTFTSVVPTTWTHLVNADTPPQSTDDQLYGLATAALETAWVGTAAAAAAGTAAGIAWSLANTAMTTSWAGTASAAGAQGQADAAYSVATAALTTAWTGTEAAAGAQGQSDSAYAYASASYELALAGTVGVITALDLGASSVNIAVPALETSWVGTSTAHEAYSVALSALEIAWVGTDAATAAYNVARSGLDIAWVGTNAASIAIQSAAVGGRAGTFIQYPTIIDSNVPNVFLVDTSVFGEITVDLPPVSGCDDWQYIVKKYDSNANSVVVRPNSEFERIDNGLSFTLSGGRAAVTLICESGTWNVVSYYVPSS